MIFTSDNSEVTFSGFVSFNMCIFYARTSVVKTSEENICVNIFNSAIDVNNERTRNTKQETRDTDSHREGNRVISMTLYGSNPQYTNGALENAKRIGEIFPGWKLRIYLSFSDAEGSTKMDLAVPHEIACSLKSHGC